jgi:hypothetical protein
MVTRGVDLSAQRAVVKKFVVDVVGAETRVGHLLRATNQAVVAPSTIEAHVGMMPTLLFKDSGARPWEVVVRLTDTGVEVAHLRGQCHFDRRAEDQAFEFMLETVLVFDRSLRTIAHSAVSVTEYSFGPKTSEAKKAELTALFNAHLKKPDSHPLPRYLSRIGRRPPGSAATI